MIRMFPGHSYLAVLERVDTLLNELGTAEHYGESPWLCGVLDLFQPSRCVEAGKQLCILCRAELRAKIHC